MNQIYKSPNKKSSLFNYRMPKNLNGGLSETVFGKINWSQAYLFKENIQNKILNRLSPVDLKSLANSMELVYLDKHQYLYQPEDSMSFLYFPNRRSSPNFKSWMTVKQWRLR